MKNILYLVLIPFVLYSCDFFKDKNPLTFNKVAINSSEMSNLHIMKNVGWHNIIGGASIDSTTIFKEGEYSLFSHTRERYGQQMSSAAYTFNSENIQGDSIHLNAYFKAQPKDSMKVYLGISQVLATGKQLIDTIQVKKFSVDSSSWFQLKTFAKLDDSAVRIQLSYLVYGGGKIWTSNWHATIDNKPLGDFLEHSKVEKVVEDIEFNKSSTIDLETLTPQMMENLDVLGKVWGFLKYYHPTVIRDEYNWDYELFRILPKVATTKDKAERSKVLIEWIDGLGKFKNGEELKITDPEKYSRIIDLSWINDESIFDKNLIMTLNRIKNAERNKIFNYNVLSPSYGSTRNNEIEKRYSHIKWDDQGYRILTLFRLWNAVEYCFPYVELMDKPWRPLLKEYIPQFVEAKSKADYELSLIKLFSHVNESHGWINIPEHSLWDNHLVAHYWAQRAPFKMSKTDEGQVLVVETQCKELQRGDVVLKVEGRDIHDLVKEKASYIATSNESTLYRDVLPSILSYYPLPFVLTVERNGKEIHQKISSTLIANQNKVSLRSPESYNIQKQNIGYIDVSKTSADDIKKIMSENKKGVILDLRIYPNGAAFQTLLPLLTDDAYTYVWFSKNQSNHVGNYKFDSEYKTPANADYYKGKVAILVNEGTQSHGEFSVMAYSKAPQSVVIGSQTAGADGNIQTFYLPGNISITYTGLGTYYPDWGMCQRVGINIDIPIRPTVKGVSEGRDELLEEAIKYILR